MGLVLLVVLFQLCRQMILPNEGQLRHDFHLAVKATFPEAARDLADRMGIHPFQGFSMFSGSMPFDTIRVFPWLTIRIQRAG